MGSTRPPSDQSQAAGQPPAAIGFRFIASNAFPDGPHHGPGAGPAGHDPVVGRPLGPGLALMVVTDRDGGGPQPVHHRHCRRWGLDPTTVLALAVAATRRLPAERHAWRLGPDPNRWLTLLRAGPLTAGLVLDLAHRVPGGAGHGLLTAPDPGTLAVVAGPHPLSPAETARAAELLQGLARQAAPQGHQQGHQQGHPEADRTTCWLIQFHPAGEFAIFGRDRKRPDHRMP